VLFLYSGLLCVSILLYVHVMRCLLCFVFLLLHMCVNAMLFLIVCLFELFHYVLCFYHVSFRVFNISFVLCHYALFSVVMLCCLCCVIVFI